MTETANRIDADLLEAWRKGDRRAQQRLVDRHRDAVFCFFANKFIADADALVEQTFATFMRREDPPDGLEAVFARLLATAHRVMSTKLTELGGRALVDPAVSRMVDVAPNPRSVSARRREQRLLLLAMRNLSIEHQTALELRTFEELGVDAIAEIVGVEPAVASSRLAKADRQLAELVEELGESQDEIDATLDNLELWMTRLRAQLLASA